MMVNTRLISEISILLIELTLEILQNNMKFIQVH